MSNQSRLTQSPASVLTGHTDLYCLFANKKVTRILSADEFDSLLDQTSTLTGCSGPVFMAYVVTNRQHLIESTVLFVMPLDANGMCQDSWSLPLQRLAHMAGRGPNLGAGRIRLACHSQCSISWHQNNLWDPSTEHFKALKQSIEQHFKENTLPSDKADDLNQMKREIRNESLYYRHELNALQQEVERQKLLNERLTQAGQTATRSKSDGLSANKIDLQILRRQNEQLSMKVQQQQLIIEKLRNTKDAMTDSDNTAQDTLSVETDSEAETLINNMSQQDMMVVVYHHGAGHLNLSPGQLLHYLDDPIAFVAKHIKLSKLQYTRWLAHEKHPKCHVCDDEISIITDPSAFNFDQDVYCLKHKP